MIQRLRELYSPLLQISSLRDSVRQLSSEVEGLKILAAQPLIQGLRSIPIQALSKNVEFRVFSQFGDDGIIQYLIHHLPNIPESFIEFGVQDYRESNTRFLLLNDNWRGLIMDGGENYVRSIQEDDIYWRHTLTARCAFVDRDNINQLIKDAGFAGDIGLLSIDIDGNDYWVWETLTVVNPSIVVIEYNSVFGPELAVTVPYDSGFVRHKAHYSGQFWGASLQALTLLSARKGYSLIGTNTAGNNAYFLRNDRLGQFPVCSAADVFVDARFRDSRNRSGELTYLSGGERFKEIAGMEVYDVERNGSAPLGSLAH
jgi:hypothetical protein